MVKNMGFLSFISRTDEWLGKQKYFWGTGVCSWHTTMCHCLFLWLKIKLRLKLYKDANVRASVFPKETFALESQRKCYLWRFLSPPIFTLWFLTDAAGSFILVLGWDSHHNIRCLASASLVLSVSLGSVIW